MLKIKSPTRVDLAGGTLDLWPLYNFIGGAKTINLAINIWTEATLSESHTFVIESLDYKLRWEFKNFDDFFQAMDPKLVLFQKLIKPFYDRSPNSFQTPFHLTTRSESPIGGGLGGSSSLMITLIKIFSKYCAIPFKSYHEMVLWAHNIESEILNTPTGTQDYYPAICGGLNVLNYDISGVEQHWISFENTPLQENFLLVYTGKSHHSGLNNFEVLKASVEQHPLVLAALRNIKMISQQLETAIQNANWKLIPDLFQQEYQARLQLTPAFTSPEIEKLAELSIKNGADAVKICGAGGGGCVLVWVEPNKRENVIKACEKENFQCLPARPVSKFDF